MIRRPPRSTPPATPFPYTRSSDLEHGADYSYDGKPAYEIPARNIMPEPLIESDYFIATHGYVSPASQKFYNNDRLNPYAYDEGEKFYWIRPGAVGGKSLIWGRWSFRWSPEDFEAKIGSASCRDRVCQYV